MSKTEKLELLNPRAFLKKRVQVYDSTETVEVFSSFKSDTQKFATARKTTEVANSQTIIYPKINHKGDVLELSKSVDASLPLVQYSSSRRVNKYDMKNNDIEMRYMDVTGPRVNTPCMNRVLNREHHPKYETVSNRLELGLVPGQPFSIVERFSTQTSFDPVNEVSMMYAHTN